MVSDTASGTIASFTDGSDVLPAKSVLVTLEPKQSGSGTPSPSNVRPISGWDEVEVVVSSTQSADNGTTYTTDLPQTIYGGTLDVVSGVLTVDRAMVEYDGSESGWAWYSDRPIIRIADMAEGNSMDGIANWLPTITDFGSFGVRFGYGNNIVYLDKIADTIEEITDLATFKAYLSTHKLVLCYPLATPTTIQCDPQTIQTLIGDNNVWGGNAVVVDYYADTKLYIEKMLGV